MLMDNVVMKCSVEILYEMEDQVYFHHIVALTAKLKYKNALFLARRRVIQNNPFAAI